MNAGSWKIATAKLCNQCIRDMEDEYIFAPCGGGHWAARANAAERCVSSMRRSTR